MSSNWYVLAIDSKRTNKKASQIYATQYYDLTASLTLVLRTTGCRSTFEITSRVNLYGPSL